MRLVTINAALQSAVFGIVPIDNMIIYKATKLADMLFEGQFIDRRPNTAPNVANEPCKEDSDSSCSYDSYDKIDIYDKNDDYDIYDKIDENIGRAQGNKYDIFNPFDVICDNVSDSKNGKNGKNVQSNIEPDIIALQGVFDKQAEKIIVKRLQPKYPYVLTDQRLPPFIIGIRSGLLILSKYIIEKGEIHEYKVFSGFDTFAAKSVMCAKIAYGIRDFYVFNTHLQSEVSRGFGRDLLDFAAIIRKKGEIKHHGYKLNHFETIEKQLRELKSIAESFIGKTTTYNMDPGVIIAGDFCVGDTEYITNTANYIFSGELFDDDSSCTTNNEEDNPFINRKHNLRANCVEIFNEERLNKNQNEVFGDSAHNTTDYVLTNLGMSSFVCKKSEQIANNYFVVCDFEAPKLY